MDEGILNDLLECSVCLERLDTSSRVLPCQHTFCRKCLEGIVERHKELRCPECRVLITVRIDELPPNVLLMRILEGMRNAGGAKKQPQQPKGGLRSAPSAATPHVTVHHLREEQQRAHAPAKHTQQQQHHHLHQPYAKALYDYLSKSPGDLSFKRGDIIILKKRVDNNWFLGECGSQQGVFPLTYVQVITPLPSNVPQCKALYDFRMTNDDEEGCLTFHKGNVITVIRRVDENWAEGKLDERIGIFPLAFVELNSLARSLMKLSTNAQPGPSRLAPPTPTSDDSVPLIPTDHTRTVANVHVHPKQAPPNLPSSESSSTVSSGANSSSTTPNSSSGNTSSQSSTAPSSPATPPSRTHPLPRTAQYDSNMYRVSHMGKPETTSSSSQVPQRSGQSHTSQHHHNREKRHSFTSLNAQQPHAVAHRHSAEILAGDGETTTASAPTAQSRRSDPLNGGLQLPSAYVAMYPYKPQKSDELELRKGGIYIVTERCQDGWFKGTSNRTQKCGVFPGNYVTLARGAPRSPQPSRHHDANDKSSGVSSVTRACSNLPPDLPPRATSPSTTAATVSNPPISASWHGPQSSSSATGQATPLGRSSSAIMASAQVPCAAASATTNATISSNPETKKKLKEKNEKGTVSLMRRLTSMRRSKSPPASTYSMDNPVFEDTHMSTAAATTTHHPIHVRSGSCPSQLLQVMPPEHHRKFVSTSQRMKHKERPSVLAHNPRSSEVGAGASVTESGHHHHKKSNSLDAGNHPSAKTATQTVRERFRCIAPYPPNTDYELELQVNDIIYVHKKREDGWYKGTQQRTGRTGLFPASFVEGF